MKTKFALALFFVAALNCKDSPPESPPLPIIDTTSHNFQWQVDSLGTESCALFDVAIINDTLIYAVGEIKAREFAWSTSGSTLQCGKVERISMGIDYSKIQLQAVLSYVWA